MRPSDPTGTPVPSLIRVVLVGGRPADAEQLRATLAQSSTFSFESTYFPRLTHALALTPGRDFDAMLLDVPEDEDDALQSLAQARSAFPSVPVILISELDDEATACRALQHGASGFAVKREINLRLLVTILASAVTSQRRIQQLSLARERERHLTTHDQLTGLANRALLNDHLTHGVASARRTSSKLAMLILNLDGFKTINDGLGQTAGDATLRSIATQISGCLRASDSAARLGGDEFAVLLSQLSSEADAAHVAEKILESIQKPRLFTPQSSPVTASIGIATYPSSAAEPEDLVKQADIAMHHAKSLGGNRFQFYEHNMNVPVLERVVLESQLRSSLNEGRFALHYQPQFDLRRGQIVGAEALLRWNHPEHGLVSPAAFLPVAEESGMIVPIGEWVIREACSQSARWAREGHAGLRVSVNVASKQFQEPDFTAILGEAVQEAGIPIWSVGIEIVESSFLEDVDLAVSTLNELKEMGVHISIDDFGTGYSSLAYLKRLPIDTLKIDQSFVSSLATDPADKTIIETIVHMARGLGLTTVAEGVETFEQLQMLGSYGCNRMQGYLFGKPAPPEIFSDWIDEPPFRWLKPPS